MTCQTGISILDDPTATDALRSTTFRTASRVMCSFSLETNQLRISRGWRVTTRSFVFSRKMQDKRCTHFTKSSEWTESIISKLAEEKCSLFGCNEGFIPWLLKMKIPSGQGEPYE